MRAWKLFRQLKSGELTSLFINKKVVLLPGIWIEAQCFPTKGYAVRPFWHCCETPDAPHLSTKNRIWKLKWKISLNSLDLHLKVENGILHNELKS